MKRDCPLIKDQGREILKHKKVLTNLYDPKKNILYALSYRGYREEPPTVVTSMLQVFSINVYALIDPAVTLSFAIPIVARVFMSYPIS